MTLDDLDLDGVPENVVRSARAEWVHGSSAWVITLGDAVGVLLATPGRAVWRFRSIGWTMRWGAMTQASPSGERALTVRDSAGEEYTFAFREPAARAEFLAKRGEMVPQPRHVPAGAAAALSSGYADDSARSTLKTLFLAGVALALLTGLVAATGEAVALSLVLLVPAQVCLGIAVIGWGVMLGVKAARE